MSAETLTPARVEELRRLESVATSGRWAAKLYHVRVVGPNGEPASGMRVGMWPHVASAAREEDAELIAALRSDAVELLAVASEAATLRELLTEARDMLAANRLILGEYVGPRDLAILTNRIDRALVSPTTAKGG